MLAHRLFHGLAERRQRRVVTIRLLQAAVLPDSCSTSGFHSSLSSLVVIGLAKRKGPPPLRVMALCVLCCCLGYIIPRRSIGQWPIRLRTPSRPRNERMTTPFMSKRKLIEAASSSVKFLMVRLMGRLPLLGVAREDLLDAIDRQRLGLPEPARDRRRLEQRVVDRFLGGLERRLEQRRHAVGRQQRARLRRAVDPNRVRRSGAVENAIAKSPLPLLNDEPVRARPNTARAASRFRSRASSGASVATTIMQEPSPCIVLPAAAAWPRLIRIPPEHLPDRRAAHRQHAAVVRSARARRRV